MIQWEKSLQWLGRGEKWTYRSMPS